MISKLKRKFTVLATASMLLLMTVLLLIMNLVNYSSVVTESDTVLDILSQTGTGFFGETPPPDKPSSWQINDFLSRGMSPEVPYESRYFSVTVSENGEIKESDLSRIISVDSDSAKEYIAKATESNKERGFIGHFRFLKQTSDGMTRIFFLDCGRKLDAFQTFLWTSILVGLFGCVVVFVAFLFISGRIVKPIAESYEKQKQFISDAGHEIKTPLTIINANIDLMECEGEKEELSEIRQQTKRLTGLTNELIMLSKMEEPEHVLQKTEIPFSDIVSETASSFRAPALTSRIEFREEIAPGLSLYGSPDAIRQLVSVLLENAIKYSPKGGLISISLSCSRKNAVLSVFNLTKEEINPANLPRVFDRFYRADSSRSSSTGGYGIGLSIAKAIVQAHGGSITAGTKSGSDFIITAEFPLG